MKKLLSIVLAGTLAASMVAVSATAVGAEETSSEKSPGGYGVAGEYTPSAGVQTKHLLFAMPNAWQNDTTKDPRCGGAAGLYWWTGYDTPDSKFGHGWPGWKAVKEEGKGADNLWGIDVPTYGNGETGNAMQIVWNNYLDGGTETDKTKNPFYDAAAQSNDSPAQYWSRTDDKALYDPLFRYIYKNVMVQENVEGAADLDLKSETFWVDANKLCAAALGADWEKLTAAERTYQVDNILDDAEVDYSEFGDYAENFFNEDLVGDEIYPNEESQGNGQAFTFDNMEVGWKYIVNGFFYPLYSENSGTALVNVRKSFTVTATGIDTILISTDDDVWYTLEGKMLKGQPTQKGVYIHKGKKVSVE